MQRFQVTYQNPTSRTPLIKDFTARDLNEAIILADTFLSGLIAGGTFGRDAGISKIELVG